MHSLSSLSAVNSTINLCTGPFFPKAISLSIMQCLFSSAIALQVFQSLKQNEDKSRDLGKTGKKSLLHKIQEGRKHKGPGCVLSKETRCARTEGKSNPRRAGTD